MKNHELYDNEDLLQIYFKFTQHLTQIVDISEISLQLLSLSSSSLST